jgi:hypothetical protein
MADFTDRDKEKLDSLLKAFEKAGKTRLGLAPWQEGLSRGETLRANKSLAAAKIVEGFAGSWAAQYHYGWGSTVVNSLGGGVTGEPQTGYDSEGPPVPVRAKYNKLGQRGVPEINFVPYNWNTNTFGSKGPSLVGHPIGFEIVGPTLKSPVMDWTWRVEEGTGTGGGDKLVMDARPDGNPNVVEPYTGNIQDAYGPQINGPSWTIGGAQEPNGGLYLIISDDGSPEGSLPAGRVPMAALPLHVDSARFEIFRIAVIPAVLAGQPYEIHLHPSKRLSTYFDLPLASVSRSVRAITIIKPFVTRLQAIPQSGAAGGRDGSSVSGREQTFIVLPPERAASGDNFPPYDGGVPLDGTWLQGGFTGSRAGSGSLSTTGQVTAYGGKNRLPIPTPIREVEGSLESGVALPTLVGEWKIDASVTPFTTGIFSSQLPVVRISNTQREELVTSLTFGSVESMLGWFDVTQANSGVGPDHVILNRVPETDPQTGLTYWGPGPAIISASSRSVGVWMTLHEPVSSIFQGDFNLDKIAASRLTNLIDPQWVERFEKQISDPLLAGGEVAPPAGSGAGRPDRSIFNTKSASSLSLPYFDAENPGSLMDLGFRLVLFPAKEEAGGNAIPDFDRPITSRNVIIDGSVQENQYIEVDYSAGIVRLSHPPPQSRAGVPDSPSDLIPNGIPGLGTNNPRGEVVLFAACVPYSMEDSQVGSGVRLTSHEGEGLRDFDVYSGQVAAKIDLTNTVFTGSAPYIGVSPLTGDVDIVLDRLLPCPETGVLAITRGGDRSPSFGRWGYTAKKEVLNSGVPVTALGGVTSLSNVLNPDASLTPGESRWAVLRREVVFGEESYSAPALTDFVTGDTYYGSSARTETLRFEGTRLQPEIDGSIRVRKLPVFGYQERAWGSLLPSKLPYPLGDVALATPVGNYLAEAGIWTNMDYQVTPGDPRAPKPGGDFTLTDFGPALPFNSDAGGGSASWHGFISNPSVLALGDFSLADNPRVVFKVSVEFRADNMDTKAFVGLVQDDSGAGLLSPTINFVTQGPTGGVEPGLPPRWSVLGFFLDTSTLDEWQFWTRGASGVENLVPSGASVPKLSTESRAYYLVIEVLPYGNPVRTYSPIIKMGIFDEEKNLVRSIHVTNSDLLPLPKFLAKGLTVCGGVRRLASSPGGVVTLNFHHGSVVLEKDLGIFDFPPLP